MATAVVTECVPLPTHQQWAALIAAAPRPLTVIADTFHRELGGTTYPVLLTCDDGHEYSVKGPAAPGRSLVSESVIAAAADVLQAPVPPAAWVLVPELLISLQREMVHFELEGVCHGSKWVVGCTDAMPIIYADEPGNSERMSLLRVLYSWLGAADHQLIYQKQPPHHVFSVDHNNFLPGGPLWTVADLEAAPPAVWDRFFDTARLASPDRTTARNRLEAVTLEQIALVVSAPHDSWKYPLQERIATAEYLERRRDELLALGDH